MLNATITNLSSTITIQPSQEAVPVDPGPSTALSLPGCFSWATIAVSSDLVLTCRVQDLMEPVERLSGFTVADALQQMVQAGQITVSFANLAATIENDVGGDAVANQSS